MKRNSHRRTSPSQQLWIGLLSQLMAAGCSDAVVTLGDRDPPSYRFREPVGVTELSDSAKTDNPSLTADLLEIYFTSERGGGPGEIWTALRGDPTGQFDAPRLVTELNSPGIETSPVVSGDGLTLWFASDRTGGSGDLDVWIATRSQRDARWSVPEPVPQLNSPSKDLPRPPGEHGSVMPLSSDREKRAYYAIFFARRGSVSGDFENPELVPELVVPDTSRLDAFLTDDGLSMFYVSGPSFGPADLFVTSRRGTDDPFGESVALTDLNTADDERDPWLSPDGTQIYFSSDRSGRYEIYVARARPEAP